ncbi:MAG: spore coat protein CotH [Candidatus Aldehydirespiratoraceae bacterium]|jgi:spore coat protein CotH
MRVRRQQSRMAWLAVVAGMALAACAGSSTSDPVDTSAAVTPLVSDAVAIDGEQDDVSESVVPVESSSSEAEALGRYATGDSSFLFDDDLVHTFDINLSDAALAELEGDPVAEEYVEGSLTFDGETLERVGVRYKGSIGAFLGCTAGPNPYEPSGAKTCTKLSLKIKINWDGADAEFYGQRRVQLHSLNLDQSLMHDRLGYWMFREAGVPAPRATHARVNLNGDFVGVFALIEQIDGRFTRDRFDDGTGNLYKEMWPFDGNGAVRSEDELIDSLRTNEDDDPSAEIIRSFAQELLDAGAPTDPEAARRVLGERTDVEALVAYAVVDRAIRHDDGPFHWYCVERPCEPHNFFMYEDPTSRKVHIIPWDLDNSMQLSNAITDVADGWGETQNNCDPFSFGALGLPQRSAACDPFVAAWVLLDTEYERVEAAFRSELFTPENVRNLIDKWSAQIEPLVVEAANTFDDAPSVEEWRRSIEQIFINFVDPPQQQET